MCSREDARSALLTIGHASGGLWRVQSYCIARGSSHVDEGGWSVQIHQEYISSLSLPCSFALFVAPPTTHARVQRLLFFSISPLSSSR